MPATHNKEELHGFLKTGIKLSVCFEFNSTDKYTYTSTYLGLKENAYLILDIPIRLLEELALRQLNNADVIIRGVADTELGHVIAFKTSVLMHIVKPSPLLFVRIPNNFATKPIREYGRYKLDQPCQIDHQNNIYEGTLVDFSLSGCGIATQIEPEFKVGAEVIITSPLDNDIGKDNQCKVANIKKMTKGWIIGIQFSHPIEMKEELKHNLIELSFAASSNLQP
ncbi:PilZ domain-containing protein [Vibrio sp. CAU 1672]|uniref:PilZ domain-containing protein n=1 Tax=Vibrio sp. CAU 1672 TaxID=3032594 RepID=UPI0023DB486C|nr:PilZ domain-containing protein [Vibrio sp. CAU 1672]MDF2155334.1 PilZ domain-containing protein [Vibrio sp. CAU 1672]